jgi:hypothetical protein
VLDELGVLLGIDYFLKPHDKTPCKYHKPGQEYPPCPNGRVSPFTYSNPCPVCKGYPDDTKKLSVAWLKPRLEIIAIVAAVWGGYWVFKQGDAAQKQLAEMQADSRLDQRAWVLTYGCEEIQTSNDFKIFRVIIKNIGKTPAVNVQNVIFAGKCTDIDALPRREYQPPSNGVIIVPNAATEARTLPTNGWMAHSGTLYVWGTVWYQDIFTNSHWTRFCYGWDTNNSSYFVAGVHNATDDTEPDQANPKIKE